MLESIGGTLAFVTIAAAACSFIAFKERKIKQGFQLLGLTAILLIILYFLARFIGWIAFTS